MIFYGAFTPPFRRVTENDHGDHGKYETKSPPRLGPGPDHAQAVARLLPLPRGYRLQGTVSP